MQTILSVIQANRCIYVLRLLKFVCIREKYDSVESILLSTGTVRSLLPSQRTASHPMTASPAALPNQAGHKLSSMT